MTNLPIYFRQLIFCVLWLTVSAMTSRPELACSNSIPASMPLYRETGLIWPDRKEGDDRNISGEDNEDNNGSRIPSGLVFEIDNNGKLVIWITYSDGSRQIVSPELIYSLKNLGVFYFLLEFNQRINRLADRAWGGDSGDRSGLSSLRTNETLKKLSRPMDSKQQKKNLKLSAPASLKPVHAKKMPDTLAVGVGQQETSLGNSLEFIKRYYLRYVTEQQAVSSLSQETSALNTLQSGNQYVPDDSSPDTTSVVPLYYTAVPDSEIRRAGLKAGYEFDRLKEELLCSRRFFSPLMLLDKSDNPALPGITKEKLDHYCSEAIELWQLFRSLGIRVIPTDNLVRFERVLRHQIVELSHDNGHFFYKVEGTFPEVSDYSFSYPDTDMEGVLLAYRITIEWLSHRLGSRLEESSANLALLAGELIAPLTMAFLGTKPERLNRGGDGYWFRCVLSTLNGCQEILLNGFEPDRQSQTKAIDLPITKAPLHFYPTTSPSERYCKNGWFYVKVEEGWWGVLHGYEISSLYPGQGVISVQAENGIISLGQIVINMLSSLADYLESQQNAQATYLLQSRLISAASEAMYLHAWPDANGRLSLVLLNSFLLMADLPPFIMTKSMSPYCDLNYPAYGAYLLGTEIFQYAINNEVYWPGRKKLVIDLAGRAEKKLDTQCDKGLFPAYLLRRFKQQLKNNRDLFFE